MTTGGGSIQSIRRVKSGGSAEDRARVAAEIDEACRRVGFIQILGHGIPTATTDAFASAMDGFFALDLETKKTFIVPGGSNRGFTPPKAESLSLSLSLGVESATRMNDFFEAFNVGASASDFPALGLDPHIYAENLWPEVDGYQTAIEAYFSEAARVARSLTDIFAAALGLEAGFFDAVTDHSIDVLRMNNYALPPGSIDLDGDLIGMSEHTDFGIVTVLWADRVKGLQVLGEGIWHDVSPADGALLINLGYLTARWTNERWMSTLHRVKPPIVDGTIARRRSAAFFHDGNADATITTIPSCVEPGAVPLYPPITVGEHIARKLAGSRAGTRNESAEREAARVVAAGG